MHASNYSRCKSFPCYVPHSSFEFMLCLINQCTGYPWSELKTTNCTPIHLIRKNPALAPKAITWLCWNLQWWSHKELVIKKIVPLWIILYAIFAQVWVEGGGSGSSNKTMRGGCWSFKSRHLLHTLCYTCRLLSSPNIKDLVTSGDKNGREGSLRLTAPSPQCICGSSLLTLKVLEVIYM